MDTSILQSKVIKKLESEGWKFWCDWTSTDHDDNYDLQFTTPNMHRNLKGKIHPNQFGEVTEKFLRTKEAEYISYDWLNTIRVYTGGFTSVATRELSKILLKRESPEFKRVFSTPTYDIKVSPSLKTPKKVKVTIEIL